MKVEVVVPGFTCLTVRTVSVDLNSTVQSNFCTLQLTVSTVVCMERSQQTATSADTPIANKSSKETIRLVCFTPLGPYA